LKRSARFADAVVPQWPQPVITHPDIDRRFELRLAEKDKTRQRREPKAGL